MVQSSFWQQQRRNRGYHFEVDLDFPGRTLLIPKRSTKPRVLLRIAPSLFSSAIQTTLLHKTDKDVLLNGVSYFTSPLLNWTLVGVIKSLAKDIQRVGYGSTFFFFFSFFLIWLNDLGSSHQILGHDASWNPPVPRSVTILSQTGSCALQPQYRFFTIWEEKTTPNTGFF